MEGQDIRQHRPRRPRQTTKIYLVLGVILLMPLFWEEYGRERTGQWHPFFHVGGPDFEGYSLHWFLGLSYLFITPLFVFIVARLTRPRHYILLYCFMIYTLAMILDHFLIYSQSDVRQWFALILFTYMVYYHHRYEHT